MSYPALFPQPQHHLDKSSPPTDQLAHGVSFLLKPRTCSQASCFFILSCLNPFTVETCSLPLLPIKIQMAKNPPDERLVYLALKNVFKGPDAGLRIAKKIRKLIQKHLDDGDAEVRALVAEHNIDNVCNTAKALLQDEIFASTLKAKIRFPEVFE